MRSARILLGVNVLWLGLSMLFDGLNTLLLPVRVANLSPSGQATALGLTTFVGISVGMLVQPLAGKVSDELRSRYGRFPPLALALALCAAGLGAVALAPALAALLAGYLFVQVTGNAAQAAHQALLPDLIPERLRGRGAGVKGFMDLSGALLGFAVLGWLIEARGAGAASASIAAVLLVSFAAARLLTGRDVARAAARGGPPAPGSRAVFRLDMGLHRDFVRVVASRFLFLLGTYGIGRFFLFFVADRLGLAPEGAAEEAGALLGALALLTALAALPSGWLADRYGRRPLMLAGAAISAVGALLLTTAGGVASILGFGAALSVGTAAFSAGNWALASDLAPPREAGRFLGLANFGTAGAAAAAGLLGPLVDAGEAGSGRAYTLLFVVAAAAFLASMLPLRGLVLERGGAGDERAGAGAAAMASGTGAVEFGEERER